LRKRSTLIDFSVHSIKLDDGRLTREGIPIEEGGWFRSALRTMELVFGGERERIRIADLGCCEGAYSVGFARAGFDVLGLEGRKTNLDRCLWVKDRVDLPNLRFVQDDAWNLAEHGPFDAIFCCGLLYHLDRPRAFIELLGTQAKRVMIINSHYASDHAVDTYRLSDWTKNEDCRGRWYSEWSEELAPEEIELANWSSLTNAKSFWLAREDLLRSIREAEFPTVYEQFEYIGNMKVEDYVHENSRGMFVGIRP
jgi:hypothetical protein